MNRSTLLPKCLRQSWFGARRWMVTVLWRSRMMPEVMCDLELFTQTDSTDGLAGMVIDAHAPAGSSSPIRASTLPRMSSRTRRTAVFLLSAPKGRSGPRPAPRPGRGLVRSTARRRAVSRSAASIGRTKVRRSSPPATTPTCRSCRRQARSSSSRR